MTYEIVKPNPSYDNHPMFIPDSPSFKRYQAINTEELVEALLTHTGAMAHFRMVGELELANSELAHCNTIVHFLNHREGWSLATHAEVDLIQLRSKGSQ